MAVAALGVFLAADRARDTPGTNVVVATRPVNVGATIGVDDLGLAPIDLPTEQAAQAFTSADALVGGVALGPLRTGEILQAGAVLPPELAGDPAAPVEPQHEFSFRLPRDQAVNGGLNRGERVDVLATFGTGDRAETWVMARDVVVTQIDNSDTASLGTGAEVTLTLALPDPATVLRVTHAKDIGVVTIVRTTRGLDLAPGPDRYLGPVSGDSADIEADLSATNRDADDGES